MTEPLPTTEQTSPSSRLLPSYERVYSTFFAGANILANAQSGSTSGLGISVATGVLASIIPESWIHPAKINSIGLLAAGAVTLAQSGLSGSGIAVATADFLFSGGNWLLSSTKNDKKLKDPIIGAVERTLRSPAIYFGSAYIATGFLASSILSGSTVPMAAVIALGVDVLMTTLATTGTLSGTFKHQSTSFIAVTIGSAAGVVAGVASGNLWGAANKFCSALGEMTCAIKDTTDRKRATEAMRGASTQSNPLPSSNIG